MDLAFGGQLLLRSLDGGQTWITQTWPDEGIDYFAVGWLGGVPRLCALDTGRSHALLVGAGWRYLQDLYAADLEKRGGG